MAIAQFTLICPTCGKEFKVRKVKQNRADCESYEEWAKEHPWNCPDCFKAEAEAERAADTERIEAKYHLPAIIGVSEKQIAYASRLRYEYFAEEEKRIDETIKVHSELTEEQVQQICKARNVPSSDILKVLFKIRHMEKTNDFMTETSASKIIDIALAPLPYTSIYK